MKKILTLLTGLAMAMPGTSAGDQLQAAPDPARILIVYYSRTNNTKAVAEHIRDATKGTVFEIVPERPYPQEYRATTEQAKKEINEGYRPPLKTNLDSIKDYDVIFVGTPNWWSTMAPPVATFLSSHDFSGKTVIPFITHEGTGLGRYVDDLSKLAPKANVLGAKAIRGGKAAGSKEEIAQWIRDLNVIRRQ